MNVYVIFRETENDTSAKRCFHSGDLITDHAACHAAGLTLWPGDPLVSNSITYKAMILPAEQPHAYVELMQHNNVWLWQTGWATYDYMDNYIRSMYECGSAPTYLKAAQEANESYERLLHNNAED